MITTVRSRSGDILISVLKRIVAIGVYVLLSKLIVLPIQFFRIFAQLLCNFLSFLTVGIFRR